MGVALTFGLDVMAAEAGLDGIIGRLTDKRPMLEDIGAELESSTLERFVTNVGPDGQPWKPSLRAKLKGGRTLVDKGMAGLQGSVHYVVDGQDAVEVGAGGNAAKYAAIHQTGGRITAKGKPLMFTLASGAFIQIDAVEIPARPYLGLSLANRTAIIEIAQDHAAGAGA